MASRGKLLRRDVVAFNFLWRTRHDKCKALRSYLLLPTSYRLLLRLTA